MTADRDQLRAFPSNGQCSVRITEYTVSAIPEDSISAYHFSITVAYRGRGRWAVCRLRYCFDADGNAEYESIPSEREDEWLKRFRFGNAEEAIEVAKKMAPLIAVNGYTPAQAWALERGGDV